MNVKEKDYVVVKVSDDNAKLALARVTAVSGGIAYCHLVKDSHIISLRKEVEIPLKRILALLDSNDPYPGKVFGCDSEDIYRGKKSHDVVGPLFFFYKPDPQMGEKLVKAFDKSVKILTEEKLDFIIDPSQAVWEIHRYNGEKYGGMYKRSRKPESNPHRFIIKPDMWPAVDWPYVILHEYAHHLHSQFMTSRKLNAAWVQLYKTSILVKDIDEKTTRRILDNMLGQEDLPSDFKGQLDDDDKIAFKWILKSIKAQHKLSIKELDTLFGADFRDDIAELWPTTVTSSDLAPLVTEYATKNVRELFAESFSYYMVGKEIPKSCVSLLEKSLSYARANVDK